jgi:hypothetical protein
MSVMNSLSFSGACHTDSKDQIEGRRILLPESFSPSVRDGSGSIRSGPRLALNFKSRIFKNAHPELNPRGIREWSARQAR